MSAIKGTKPGTGNYFTAALVLMLGLLVFVWILYSSLSQLGRAGHRFLAPGQAELNLSKKGDYTIYYEFQSVYEGRAYSSEENLPGLVVQVSSKDEGKKIPIREIRANSTYSFGGRKGRALFYFNVENPGTYQIKAHYINDQSEPRIVLTVGKGFVSRMIFGIFGAIGVLLLGILIGIFLIVFTFLKRDRFNRQLKGQTRF